MLRRTSCMPICSAKQSNPSNNLEIRGYLGIWSVFLTPIWTHQLGLYFWFGISMDTSLDAKLTQKKKKNPIQAKNGTSRKCSYKQNLRLMMRLP